MTSDAMLPEKGRSVRGQRLGKTPRGCTTNGTLDIPSSKPLATPEKAQTHVQVKRYQLKISRGQSRMACFVALMRLGFAILMIETRIDSVLLQEVCCSLREETLGPRWEGLFKICLPFLLMLMNPPLSSRENSPR